MSWAFLEQVSTPGHALGLHNQIPWYSREFLKVLPLLCISFPSPFLLKNFDFCYPVATNLEFSFVFQSLHTQFILHVTASCLRPQFLLWPELFVIPLSFPIFQSWQLLTGATLLQHRTSHASVLVQHRLEQEINPAEIMEQISLFLL